jgi:murein DD-endopeptidase MepM/ murein hydrolase activator NlpD
MLLGFCSRLFASRFFKPSIYAALLCGAGIAAFLSVPWPDTLPDRHEPKANVAVAPQESRSVGVTLRRGDTLLSLLARHGVRADSAHEIIAKLRPLMNLRKLRAGDNIQLVIDPADQSVQAIEMLIEDTRVRVTMTGAGWLAERERIPFVREPGVVDGTIGDSLYKSGTEAGLTPQHILDLARIFEYDIDFFSDFRRGNIFSVVAEEVRYADGRRAPGRVLAAELEAGSETSTAFHFIMKDGVESYFDGEGRALRRPFLRAPLSYARISSPFSLTRLHPILRSVRPHRAIDYAAPAGTPVVSIGAGRVEFSGWRDGYGNLVEIRHAGGYASRYGHFSRIARGIRKGAQVGQGDVLGYVGQTGHATGPHLHFEFLRGGEKVNFLALKIPRIERLTGADLERFIGIRDKRLALLRKKAGDMPETRL